MCVCVCVCVCVCARVCLCVCVHANFRELVLGMLEMCARRVLSVRLKAAVSAFILKIQYTDIYRGKSVFKQQCLRTIVSDRHDKRRCALCENRWPKAIYGNEGQTLWQMQTWKKRRGNLVRYIYICTESDAVDSKTCWFAIRTRLGLARRGRDGMKMYMETWRLAVWREEGHSGLFLIFATVGGRCARAS
jgi:hypothetical protein